MQSNKPVVVKFGAPWCPACTRSKAPYHKLSDDADMGHIKFVEMDFDTNNPTATEYDVQSLPTFLYFNKGKLAATKTGFPDNLKSEIARTVASFSGSTPDQSVQEPKKNEQEQMQAPATQEEVSNPACAASEQGFFANAINGISNFLNSVWNTVTSWFK